METAWDRAVARIPAAEIARLLGMAASSVSNAISRKSSMRADHALLLARRLDISVDELVAGTPHVSSLSEQVIDQIYEPLEQVMAALHQYCESRGARRASRGETSVPMEQKSNAPHNDSVQAEQNRPRSFAKDEPPAYLPCGAAIPVLGKTAAGHPIDIDQWPTEWALLEARTTETAATHYLLYSHGTSMVRAGINDGDLVMVRRTNNASPGDIVVAYVPGDGSTLKRLVEGPDGGLALAYEDGSGRTIPVTDDTVIQGVFVRVVEDVDG